MATDHIATTVGEIGIAYVCETELFKIVRLADGEVLLEKTIPGMTVGEWCELTDKYDKLCNHK